MSGRNGPTVNVMVWGHMKHISIKLRNGLHCEATHLIYTSCFSCYWLCLLITIGILCTKFRMPTHQCIIYLELLGNTIDMKQFYSASFVSLFFFISANPNSLIFSPKSEFRWKNIFQFYFLVLTGWRKVDYRTKPRK